MGEEPEQVVTPWEVEGGEEGIDYAKLVRDFGSTEIDQALLDRMERITGKKVHHWLRRVSWAVLGTGERESGG